MNPVNPDCAQINMSSNYKRRQKRYETRNFNFVITTVILNINSIKLASYHIHIYENRQFNTTYCHKIC